jgi:hypothetical protein
LANERAGLIGNVRFGRRIKGRQCREGGADRKTDGRDQTYDGVPAKTKSHFDAGIMHTSYNILTSPVAQWRSTMIRRSDQLFHRRLDS